MKIKVVTRILEANDRIAEENRKRFREAGVYVVNLMGAPGAGKTMLLERTIRALAPHAKIGVIEGDIAGSDDAERIAALDVPVVQINTGGACHLDANMISEVLNDLPLGELDLLMIENVGNLVCPAEFKVGEDMKMMVLSMTEGDDKPLKYPLMFQESSALVLNKTDLLPYVNTDIGKMRSDAWALNPNLKIFEVSCTTGAGIDAWTAMAAGVSCRQWAFGEPASAALLSGLTRASAATSGSSSTPSRSVPLRKSLTIRRQNGEIPAGRYGTGDTGMCCGRIDRE